MKVGDYVLFPLDGDIGLIIARSEAPEMFKTPWKVRWPSGLETWPIATSLQPAEPLHGYFMRPAHSATAEQK